jgi:hypothetical protein
MAYGTGVEQPNSPRNTKTYRLYESYEVYESYETYLLIHLLPRHCVLGVCLGELVAVRLDGLL